MTVDAESLLTIVFVVLILFGSFVSKTKKQAKQQRPGGAPRPGAFPANRVESPRTEEECDSDHEGETSCKSDEGFGIPSKIEGGMLRVGGNTAEKHEHARKEREERKEAAKNATVIQVESRAQVTAQDLRKALIMSEILNKPVSMREEN